MTRFVLQFFVVFILVINMGHAANEKWYNAQPLSFSFKLPEKEKDQWLVGPAIGLPLVVLSPVKKGYRRTMSLTPEITFSNQTVTLEDMKSEVALYESGRKKYVQERKGKVHKFFPIEEIKNIHGLDIFRIGYNYTIGDKKIVEYSYRFTCKGNVVAGMMRYYPDFHGNDMKDYEQIWRTLDCKKGAN